ncbi:MAG: hypothetical protein P4M11_07400 [Candidatus Pacebacteria bacterium]|nr:hypothetical protein [Candidatus Paceibacterota bacterium]
MDPLARLFSSSARLKLLRLFLFNDDSSFTVLDAAFRINVPKEGVRRELKTLLMSGIVRKKTTKEGLTYTANKRFVHYEALQTLLRDTTNLDDASIVNSLKKGGTIRLIILSGLFTGALETKADILIVGDRIDDKHLDKAVHELEAELGRELRFAAFSTQDFRYRVGVYDRLIRDIFDYPHRTLFDKIGITAV